MSGNRTSRSVAHTAMCGPGSSPGNRHVPEEMPIAFSFLGTTHAVMMASPADLEDFAYGFCLSEGIIADAGDIEGVEPVPVQGGLDLQIALAPALHAAFTARRRQMAGPVGCGLCGIESIEEALRGVPPVEAAPPLTLSASDIAASLDALTKGQHLNRLTRAVHGAGFYTPRTGMVAVREDVGRHNALDKLAGALIRARKPAGGGAIVISSRVSVEMVQKTARLGAPILIAVSAPTALALEVAEQAGITLVAVARDQACEVFTHPERITKADRIHVA